MICKSFHPGGQMKAQIISAEDFRLLQEVGFNHPALSIILDRVSMGICQWIPVGGYVVHTNGSTYHERTCGGHSTLTRDGFPIDESTGPNILDLFLAVLKSYFLCVILD